MAEDESGAAGAGAKGVDCRRCVHYYVTWEPSHPHGCRAMKFKSRVLPALEVRRASGQNCLAFQEKPGVRW